MGLDSVELAMAIEEEFSIEISEADGAQCRSVGSVHYLIIRLLKEKGAQEIDEQEIMDRLRTVVVRQLNVRPEQVQHWTRFVEDLGMN